MPPLKDLTGKRFGHLTVIKRAPNKGSHVAWECLCDCGNTTIVRGNNLTRENYRTTTCGCKIGKNIVGEHYKNNSKKLNDLLQIPSNLYIWCHLDKSKIYDNCFTTNKLIEEWWQQLLDKSSELKMDSSVIENCKNEIVKKMFNMSKTSIMRKILNVNEDALKYLSSNGFLFIENQNISFTHQRIYDYFIEIEMINMYQENKTIEEIIGDIEQQTPSRRYKIHINKNRRK